MQHVLRAKVLRHELPEHRHRWFGVVELDNGLYLYMSGIAAWLFEGDEVEVVLKNPPKKIYEKNVLLFEDYELYKIYNNEKIKIWNVFHKYIELPRLNFGREVYRYKILAREAIYEKDFEAIAELEQYHYASEKSKVALWKCYDCEALMEANTKPRCENCGGENVHIVEIKGSTPASRFLVFELLDRQPYEPEVVAYVRVDPAIPLMHRRIDGKIIKNIRKHVFPEEWFKNVFWPEKEFANLFKQLRKEYSLKIARHKLWEKASKEAMKKCNSAASRIARVVVHPDYRADGIGVCAVKTAVEWIAERRVPEMRMKKHLVETIARMAKYNPFFEKAGFYYLWDTASGRPVLYCPLTKEAKQYISLYLSTDEIAKKHKGKLCVSRYGKVKKMKKLKFVNVSKLFRSVLDLEGMDREVEDVLSSFGVKQRVVERYVFRNLNLEIRPGEIVAVVGASGAGKTTLLRLIIGAVLEFEDESYLPTDGKIEASVPQIAAIIPAEIEPEIDENKSILEQIYEVCGDVHLAVEVLNRAGISDAVLFRARYHELSTGQKERFRLALCLAKKPSLMLVDEFAAHLDEVTAMRVARKISRLAREAGITLIAVTHRKEVVDALAPDRILYVGYGGVLESQGEVPH